MWLLQSITTANPYHEHFESDQKQQNSTLYQIVSFTKIYFHIQQLTAARSFPINQIHVLIHRGDETATQNQPRRQTFDISQIHPFRIPNGS